MYSVDQVAGLLGLHVKTVRGYVREGRLKAVRVGKQYRITPEDLEAFTGGSLPAPTRRSRHVEASTIVQIDAISPEAMSRLSTVVIASASGPYEGERVRAQTVYDEERGTMKIILFGGPGATADLLRLIATLVEQL